MTKQDDSEPAAPERIWIEDDEDCPYFYHDSELSEVACQVIEYVRADLADAKVAELEAQIEELDFLRHEGGPQSVAAMEACLRDVCLPVLRCNAVGLFRTLAVRNDPASISGPDWRYIAADMEAVLAAEAIVGRPDDKYGRILNPILDAAPWRHYA